MNTERTSETSVNDTIRGRSVGKDLKIEDVRVKIFNGKDKTAQESDVLLGLCEAI
jgi:hypothetical protein